jgi:hypothetical protein
MAQVVMVTENGEEHGLVNTIANSVKDHGYVDMTPENRTKVEKMRKDESRTVKARYINHRGMHERLDKHYMRYPGDAIKKYHLIPGYTYDLPYGLVKEVNENPGLAQREGLEVNGQVLAKDAAPFRLHELVPVGF